VKILYDQPGPLENRAMIAIKLVFYSVLFLGLVTMIAGPWVALVAFIALVAYGVTRKGPNQQLADQAATVERQRVLVAREEAQLEKLAAMLIAEARFTQHVDQDGVRLLTNPN
jgi:hypothetical protein